MIVTNNSGYSITETTNGLHINLPATTSIQSSLQPMGTRKEHLSEAELSSLLTIVNYMYNTEVK